MDSFKPYEKPYGERQADPTVYFPNVITLKFGWDFEFRHYVSPRDIVEWVEYRAPRVWFHSLMPTEDSKGWVLECGFLPPSI